MGNGEQGAGRGFFLRSGGARPVLVKGGERFEEQVDFARAAHPNERVGEVCALAATVAGKSPCSMMDFAAWLAA